MYKGTFCCVLFPYFMQITLENKEYIKISEGADSLDKTANINYIQISILIQFFITDCLPSEIVESLVSLSANCDDVKKSDENIE